MRTRKFWRVQIARAPALGVACELPIPSGAERPSPERASWSSSWPTRPRASSWWPGVSRPRTPPVSEGMPRPRMKTTSFSKAEPRSSGRWVFQPLLRGVPRAHGVWWSASVRVPSPDNSAGGLAEVLTPDAPRRRASRLWPRPAPQGRSGWPLGAGGRASASEPRARALVPYRTPSTWRPGVAGSPAGHGLTARFSFVPPSSRCDLATSGRHSCHAGPSGETQLSLVCCACFWAWAPVRHSLGYGAYTARGELVRTNILRLSHPRTQTRSQLEPRPISINHSANTWRISQSLVGSSGLSSTARFAFDVKFSGILLWQGPLSTEEQEASWYASLKCASRSSTSSGCWMPILLSRRCDCWNDELLGRRLFPSREGAGVWVLGCPCRLALQDSRCRSRVQPVATWRRAEKAPASRWWGDAKPNARCSWFWLMALA